MLLWITNIFFLWYMLVRRQCSLNYKLKPQKNVNSKKINTKYSISDLKYTSVLSFNIWQAIESVLQKIDVNARSSLALILFTNNAIYITMISYRRELEYCNTNKSLISSMDFAVENIISCILCLEHIRSLDYHRFTRRQQ